MSDKEHYTNFHWGDWLKDTASLRPSTRGIWLDMIGHMANRGTDRVHATFERLPFVLRATPHEIMLAALELAENDTAEVQIDGKPIIEFRNSLTATGGSELDWIANQMAKAWLTIVCRRRTKELAVKAARSAAGKAGADSRYGKHHGKPVATDIANPIANTMANAGIGIGNGNGSTGGGAGGGVVEPPSPAPSRVTTPAFDAAAKNVIGAMRKCQGIAGVPTTFEQCEPIFGLLNDGFTEADLLLVVRHRWKLWHDSAQMKQHFTVATLFKPEKFPDYLAQARAAYPSAVSTNPAAQPPPPVQPQREPTPTERLALKRSLLRSAEALGNPVRVKVLKAEIASMEGAAAC